MKMQFDLEDMPLKERDIAYIKIFIKWKKEEILIE